MSESRSVSASNAATTKTNQGQQQQDKNTKPKEPFRLYVGGLNYSTTTAMLRKAFEEFGKVLDGTEVICDRSGNSKGFGFVNFEEEASLEQAKEKMNNSELDGRKIQVMMAQPEKKYNRDSSKSKGQRSNYQNHAPFRGYRVRIQNLPHNITWRELKDFLRQAGEVKYADINSPGVGIGEFGSASERMNVIKALNGKELRGNKIRINILNESDMHYGHPSSYGMHHHHHGPNSHFFSEPFPPFGPGYDMSYGPSYESYGYGPPIEYNPHHHHHPVPFGPPRVNFWGRSVSGGGGGGGGGPRPPPPYTPMSPFSHSSFPRGVNSGSIGGNGGNSGGGIGSNSGNQGRLNEMRSGWRHYGSNTGNHRNMNSTTTNSMYNGGYGGYGSGGNNGGSSLGNGGPIRSYNSSNRSHNHTPYRRFYDSRSSMRGYMNGSNNGMPSNNAIAMPMKDYDYDNMLDDFPKMNNSSNTHDMGYDDKMHFDRNVSSHYIGFNHMSNTTSRGGIGGGNGNGGYGGSSSNFNEGSGHIDPPLPRTLHGSGAYDRMPKDDWNTLNYGGNSSSGYNGMNTFSDNTSRYSRYESHTLHNNMKNNINDRNYPNYALMSTATAPVPPAPPLPPSQQQTQNQTSIQNHNTSSAPLENHRHSNGGNVGGGSGGGGGGGSNSQTMPLEDRRSDYHHHHHHDYTTRERNNSGYKQSTNSNGPTYDYAKMRSTSNAQYTSKERIDNSYSRGGSRSEMVTHMDSYSQNRRDHDYGSKNDSMRYSNAANAGATTTTTEHKTGRDGRDMEYYSLSDRRPDYNSSSSRNYRDDELRTAGGVDRHRRPSHRVTPYNR